MHVKLTKRCYLTALSVYTVLVGVAILAKVPLGLASVFIIFPYMVLVPGLLVLLALRIKTVDAWSYLFYIVCLSLLLLMLIGLSANWILPLLGIKDPLHTAPLMVVFMAQWLDYCFG